MSDKRYVCVDGTEYEATIEGRIKDSSWDDRESKRIHLFIPASDAVSIFKDGTAWSIIIYHTNRIVSTDDDGNIIYDETGEPIIEEETTVRDEYDNSDYNVLGDIIQHVDGTCTVCMGKTTPLEEAYEILLGGN